MYIHPEIALLSQYLDQPRRGHHGQAFHVLSYFKSYIRSKTVLDLQNIYFDEKFTKYNWEDFYGKVE